MSKKEKRPLALRVRNWVAVAAHTKSGAGAHGGTVRQRNRRDRRAERQRLRDGSTD